MMKEEGSSLASIETTARGGWFNIVKVDQRSGTYLIPAYKSGYHMRTTSVTYAGEPLNITMEVEKR